MHQFKQLPDEVAEIANAFLNIEIEGKTFPSPYFMNKAKSFAHASLSGKGTPGQITDLVKSTAYAFSFDLKTASVNEIRQFMLKNDIGIDCSGLAYQLMNKWVMLKKGKPLIKFLKMPRNPLRKALINMRSISQISAEKLTNLENTDPVALRNIEPGDLIRAKGIPKGDHVLVVTDVERDKGIVKSFEYIQSISKYGDENGVRLGKVIVKNQLEPLEKQEWTDKDKDGINYTLEEYKYKVEDNGIRRLKALK